VIVDYIGSHRDRFGVEPICAVLSEHGLQIAPSTYYARRAQPVTDAELEDAYLANALVTLHAENWGVYGARKLWQAAHRAGLDLGRDQVARLMRLAGITGAVRGRTHRTTTTRRDAAAARHPDLVQRGWDAPTATDELWVADFSYVWTLTGFVFVAFVVDVFSRRLLGWRVSSSRQTSLVLDALRQAVDLRHRGQAALGVQWNGHGLVHHSDAGSQYTSLAFTAELLDAGIAGSIGSVGDALDNALCESTIGLFKTEAIDDGGPTWTDRSAVEWQVARWVHWYNTGRLHSSIGYLPPIEFEQQHRQAKETTPDQEVINQPALR
jgi:transposase InsO family protein